MVNLKSDKAKVIAAFSILVASYGAGFFVLMRSPSAWPALPDLAAKAIVAGVLSCLTVIFAGCASFACRAFRPGRFAAAVVAVSAVLVYASVAVMPALGIGDVYHYAIMARGWIIHGLAPYSIVPAALPADPLFGYIKQSLRAEPSIYGPFWVAVSALPVIAAKSAAVQVVMMKLLSIVSYAGAGFVLARLLRDRMPAAPFLAVWLLNPLAVFEIGNNGHNEGCLVLLLSLFILGVARNSPRLALPALTMAAAMKYWPVILLPAVLGIRESPRRRWLEGIILSAILVASVFAVLGVRPSAVLPPVFFHQSLISPHYFSPFIAAVWNLFTAAGWPAGEAFAAAQGLGFAATAVVVCAAGVFVRRNLAGWRVACVWISSSFFLCSVSWLQPWYLLSLLPFLLVTVAAKYAVPATAVICSAAVLAYPLSWSQVLAVAAAATAILILLRPGPPGFRQRPRGLAVRGDEGQRTVSK